jgi:hypothetical protein
MAAEQSLFLNVVPAEKQFRNSSTLGSGVLRPSDRTIAARQFPVGWRFFYLSNVDRIAQQLGTTGELVVPLMVEEYLKTSPEEIPATDTAAVQEALDVLRQRVGDRYAHVLHETRAGAARYKQWRKTPARLAAHPQSVLAKDAMIQTNPSFDQSTQRMKFRAAQSSANNLPQVDLLRNFV